MFKLNKKHFTHAILHLPLILFAVITLWGCSGDNDEKLVAGEKIYTCPMHPQVVSDKPGVCPICHMDLVLKGGEKAADQHEGDLTLSAGKQMLANVSTVKVKRENVSKIITAYSYLDFAEQNKRLITARFNGRIEKLFVNNTGDFIRKGTPLFEIYSPDLVQAQNEYLIALNGLAGQNARLITANTKNQNENVLASSAKQKLLLLGLTEEQISDLKASQKPALTLTYYSPFSGTVIEKKVQEGMYVNEGSVIYDIADLSTIWSISEVYESDISSIKQGSRVQLRLNSYPGETFEGRVNLLYPVVNAESRTIKIRSVFANNGNKLKPNMYGETLFSVNLGNGLTIPSDAVLMTGKRNLVWVKTGESTFESREVILGTKFNDSYQVISGLEEGEEIAATGAYLIDSESQLKSGLSGSQHQGHTTAPKEESKRLKDESQNSDQHVNHTTTSALPWNKVCPVLGGKVNPKIETVNYKGKKIGFCCPGCDKDFKADPDKYIKNLSADGISFTEFKEG